MVNDIKTRYQLRDYLLRSNSEHGERHHPTLLKSWDTYKKWNKTLNGTLKSFGSGTSNSTLTEPVQQPARKRVRRVRGGSVAASSTRTTGIDAQVLRLEALYTN